LIVLRLVNPQCDPKDGETRARAKHARDVLESLTIHDSLENAVSDCSLVVGTSGKKEIGEKTLFRHFVYPWDFSEMCYERTDKIALVFGEEGLGLSTEDMRRCDVLTTLPTWEGYPIANLSHAVNAFLYEVHRQRFRHTAGLDRGVPEIVPLTTSLNPEIRQIFLKALHQYSIILPCSIEKQQSIMDVFQRVILKGNPSTDELSRLIGAFVESTTALQYVNGDESWKKNRRKRVLD